MNTQIHEMLYSLQQQLQEYRYRALVVLAGERPWSMDLAEQWLKGQGQGLWLGEREQGESVVLEQARSQLGREYSALVFNAWSGFNAEALAASAGTLCAGGMLLLLVPPLETWPQLEDASLESICVHGYRQVDVGRRFLKRFIASIKADGQSLLIEQDKALPLLPQSPPIAAPLKLGHTPFRSADQEQAFKAITRVVQGHRRRPLVLTSDRGRGKSSVLGLAAAHGLEQGLGEILVTAPRRAAVNSLFEQAAQQLKHAKSHANTLQLPDSEGGGRIRFIAPDELLRTRPKADLLLVDEAAAIPTALLEQMLSDYARIVFASTVHGYEGTGMGFSVRFPRILDERCPGWHALHLNTPIRWAEGCPLEALLFKALLLDAEPLAEVQALALAAQSVLWQRLDRDVLAVDEGLLHELFGLLVLAHYRTSPHDLQQILDAPGIRVYALLVEGHCLATALVAEEGELDEALSQAIWRGERRPQGHLLAQSLATHLGRMDGPGMRCWRVVRIAVHPALQGQGLGSRLLEAVSTEAREQGVDFFGSSFGATRELWGFWSRNHFDAVDVGIGRGTSSGVHALLVLQATSAKARKLLPDVQRRFYERLLSLLPLSYHDLDPELVLVLLQGHSLPLNWCEQDHLECEGFAYAQRADEQALLAIERLLLKTLSAGAMSADLNTQQRTVLVERVLKKQPWQLLQGIEGRRQGIKLLRGAVSALLALQPNR